MNKKLTNEEKVALAIAKLITNLELDIEQVGRLLGRFGFMTLVAYNRFIQIAESAKYEKENNERNYI